MKTGIFIFVFSLLLVFPAKYLRSALNHSVYQSADECLECHEMQLPNHKLGQPKKMSEQLPLDPAGQMLCLTCHDCIPGTCALRKNSTELCEVCHDCTQGMACLIGIAHMGNSPNLERLSAEDCLSCHDGQLEASAGGKTNSMIDVFYISNKDFHELQDRRVILVDGRVKCISCHNPYSHDDNRLVMSNQQSRLCVTCHAK